MWTRWERDRPAIPQVLEVSSLITPPIAAFDVAKHSSKLCVLSPANEKFIDGSNVKHTEDGFKKLSALLEDVERIFEVKPVCVMESTGPHHKRLFEYLTGKGYEVSVVNPLQSKSLQDINIRGAKTDEIDAYHLALLYRLKVTKVGKIPDDAVLELRTLTRQYFSMSDTLTQYKNRARSAIDLLFPRFDRVFPDKFSATALAALKAYPSTQHLDEASDEDLIALISSTSRRSTEWARRKVQQLRKEAQEAPGVRLGRNGLIVALQSNLTIIETLQKQLAEIEKAIVEVAEPLEGYQHLITMPGMGPVSAAAILGEIGDICWFKNARQLVAFCGIDPTVRQSGQFKGSRNRMSKRGSPLLRRALYVVAMASIRIKRNREEANPVLRQYYLNKLAAGKAKKVALGAIMRKLVHYVYAVLRDGKPFELRTPQQHIQTFKAA